MNRIEAIQEKLSIPVAAETDVLVLGGGPSGIAAAVSAARLGARVTLIERYGYFGGLATGGFIILYFANRDNRRRLLKGGISTEILDRLNHLGALENKEDPHPQFHPEYLKLIFQRMILENGITPVMNTLAVGAQVIDDRIDAVILENKSGRSAIRAKVVIDSTGDADSALWCGVPFERMDPAHLKPMALVYRFGNVDTERAETFLKTREATAMHNACKEAIGHPLRWARAFNTGEVWSDKIQIADFDAADPDQFARAEFEGRETIAALYEFYRRNVPGFEKASWIDTAPQMGVRVSRRIRGKHWLTAAESRAANIPDDTVVLNYAWREKEQIIHGVPYGCLLPKSGPSNLLYAGRCVSAAMDAIDAIREVPSCVCLGQAAGTGAALALENGNRADVDRIQLRKTLLNNGAILSLE